LYPNGDILAIHSRYALIKVDRNSKLLWEYPIRAHHDLDVVEDGRVYVLTAESRRLPRIHAKQDILEDFIVVLSAEGKELQKVSLLEAVENAGLEDLLEIMPRHGDLFHTNTIAVLDGRFTERNPAFRRGNVLVSFLTINTVAVVDLEAVKVVWTLRGDFRFQHDPQLLGNGHILLFDNFGPAMRDVPLERKRGWLRNLWYTYAFNDDKPENPASAVIEIDPQTGRVVWSYEGSEEKPFSSQTLGAAHRLGEGNTLIVESEFGRSFEVTPEGEIVWEFVSPHRVGDLVARLFDVVRLPPDFPVGWARGVSGEAEGG
jgi:outer membrane protein assembly factor BamB